jgi:hypothetical protein
VHIGQPFLKFARDINGNRFANHDYSTAPWTFTIEPPPNESYIMTEFFTHMLLPINVGDRLKFDEFGTLPMLTNGITIKHVDGVGDVLNDFTDGLPIKMNFDFLHFGEIRFHEFRGSWVSVQLFSDFRTNSEHRVYLDGKHADKIVITVNDDLSGMSDIHWMLWGWRPEPHE